MNMSWKWKNLAKICKWNEIALFHVSHNFHIHRRLEKFPLGFVEMSFAVECWRTH